MRRSYRRRNWCRAKRRRVTLNGITDGSATGLDASSTGPSLSRSPKAMVDLTMALFAKFGVNGNQDALLSLPG
jgi:hypothetical protein